MEKTYREKFLEAYNLPDKSYSIKEISKITHIPQTILRQVYKRGVGAYSTQGDSVRLQHSFVKNVKAPMKAKLSKQQWAMSRIFSFIMGNPKHDNDLRKNKKGVKGSGIFDSIKNTFTTFVERGKQLIDKGLRTQLPPSARKTLGEYGDWNIIDLDIRRDAIQSFLHLALNAITLGKWQQARGKYNYDKLFHLGLEMTVSKGGRRTHLLIEKNEVIYFGKTKPVKEDTEYYNISVPQPIQVQRFIDEGIKMKGNAFFLYDAFKNNCQDFIMGLLRANSLLTPQAGEFIKQPVDELIQDLPSYTGSIARGATDLASGFNYILEGEGRDGHILGDGKICSGCGMYKTRVKVGLQGGVYDAQASMRERMRRAHSRTPEEKARDNIQHEARIAQIQQENVARQKKIDDYNAEMRRRRDSPLGKVVQGLTDVADFGVKYVAPVVGVPSVVSNIYKSFAPPTSEFYKGAGKNLISHLDTFVKQAKGGAKKKRQKKSRLSAWKKLQSEVRNIK
jgi:hypothetical protein